MNPITLRNLLAGRRGKQDGGLVASQLLAHELHYLDLGGSAEGPGIMVHSCFSNGKQRAKELLTPPDGEQQEVDDEQPPLVQHQVPAEHQLEAAWTSTLPSCVQYSYTSDYMQPKDFGSKMFVDDPPKELKWMVVSHVCLCLQTST